MQQSFIVAASISAFAAATSIASGANQIMAQTFAQAEANLTCTVTQDRNKATPDDFYGIYQGSEDYTDDDFTADATSLYWETYGEPVFGGTNTHWVRAKDAFPTHSLFGHHGVGPDDVRQGAIGNCYFMSAAAALAEVPGRLEKIFLNNVDELSPNGIYGVQMMALGLPQTVIVDDYLPLK